MITPKWSVTQKHESILFQEFVTKFGGILLNTDSILFGSVFLPIYLLYPTYPTWKTGLIARYYNYKDAPASSNLYSLFNIVEK
jgi:hypothetical protein